MEGDKCEATGMVASHRVLCIKSHTAKGCLSLTARKGAMRRMWGNEAVREQGMEGPPPLPCVSNQCSGLKGLPVSMD